MSVSINVPAFRVPKTVALVGLMGTGKTAVGKRLAQRLGLPFVDADAAIEAAAGNVTIEEIFELHGEPFFRAREREVVKRLLGDPVCVLATGGGAYLDEETRALIRERAISIWLKADIDLMMSRVARRNNRPLLKARSRARCSSSRSPNVIRFTPRPTSRSTAWTARPTSRSIAC